MVHLKGPRSLDVESAEKKVTLQGAALAPFQTGLG